MICQQVTLSGDAEWPKVADAMIEAQLRVGDAAAPQTGEKPRRDQVCSNPATLHSDLSGDEVPLPRHCRVYRARPSNDWAATCVKGGTHPPSGSRACGTSPGPSGGCAERSPPRGAACSPG